MIDRINLILKAKNITARQFAEEIGIQPSGMSHILSGRNRPSLDFVMKVVARYPEIDIKWLMFGEGELYVQPHSMPTAPTAAPTPQTVAPMQTAPAPTPIVANNPDAELDLFSGIESMQPTQPSQPAQSTQPMPQAQTVQPEPPAQPQHPSMVPPVQPLSSPVENNQRNEETPIVGAEGDDNTPNRKPYENRLFETRRDNGSEYENVVRKRIVKMVILYDDHSFAEYYPE